jgi:hypothetical protein
LNNNQASSQLEYLFSDSNDVYWDTMALSSAINISGTCHAFDQTTTCGNLGVIKVAVNGNLQVQTDPNGGSGAPSSSMAPPTRTRPSPSRRCLLRRRQSQV